MYKKLLFTFVIAAALVAGIPFSNFNMVNAATLNTGSVTLSDSRINTASVTYTIQFSNVTTSSIKCIRALFSDAATGGSKPAGLGVTSAALSGTSNYIPTPASWTPANNNSTGEVKLTYATGEVPASSSSRTVVLTGITNGSIAGTVYFVQFSTFSNTDCSTGAVDSATIAFIYTDGQSVTATVDPTLTFSISGVASGQTVNGATTNITTTSSTVPFGTLSAASNKIGAQDLAVGTNAGAGYTVTVLYSGTFTNGSGGNIADFTGLNSAPTTFSSAGTPAFGYTTEDAVLGTGTAGRFTSGKWAKFTTAPLEVAYNAAAASETTRVGYQVGISATTPAGSYTTTVTYTATPTY